MTPCDSDVDYQPEETSNNKIAQLQSQPSPAVSTSNRGKRLTVKLKTDASQAGFQSTAIKLSSQPIENQQMMSGVFTTLSLNPNQTTPHLLQHHGKHY